eukprot:gene2001-33425_t
MSSEQSAQEGGIPGIALLDAQCPEVLKCAICLDMCSDPVMTPCDHIFCKLCVQVPRQHSSSSSSPFVSTCPLCRKNLPRSLPSLKTSSPSLYRVWNGIQLRCPYSYPNNCT